MIKLLHSSDWHLGKSLFAKSLLDDQAQALAELTTMIVSEKPNLIILAGDLFDRSVPPEDAVRLLDQFLVNAILKLGVPVAMIPGNHDSSTRVGVSAGLLRSAGLHVFATPASIALPLRISGDGVEASVYGIPFLEPAEWGFHFGRTLRTHSEALEAILESLEPSLTEDRAAGRRTVLILHAYVTGGEASDSERPLSIGGSDLVSAELLEKFDYVALGHLHRPQSVLHDRIRYPGSLFPYSQSEASQPKGAMIVSLAPAVPRMATNAGARDEFRFAEFRTTRSLRVVRGELDALVAQAAEEKTAATEKGAASAAADVTDRANRHRDDYIIAVLTDSSLPFEAYRRLHQVYPGLLHVARDVAWTREGAETADGASRANSDRHLREVSDRDMLAQFILAASNGDLTDEDREWLVQELEAFATVEKISTEVST